MWVTCGCGALFEPHTFGSDGDRLIVQCPECATTNLVRTPDQASLSRPVVGPPLTLSIDSDRISLSERRNAA